MLKINSCKIYNFMNFYRGTDDWREYRNSKILKLLIFFFLVLGVGLYFDILMLIDFKNFF